MLEVLHALPCTDDSTMEDMEHWDSDNEEGVAPMIKVFIGTIIIALMMAEHPIPQCRQAEVLERAPSRRSRF
jgi:hypothetical protein